MRRPSPSGRAWALLAAVLLAAAPPASAQEGGRQGGDGPSPAVAEALEEPVVAVRVSGASRYAEEELAAFLGQEVGRPLDPQAVTRGIEELWERLRVRAFVDVREVEEGIELLLRVTEMPLDLEPRFLGNVEVSDEELYEWARLEPESELYLFQAPRIRERLLDAYRRDGYYFVEIEDVVREGGRTPEGRWVAPDVIFRIREGPRVRIRDVEVHGNESMPDRGMLFWKEGLRAFAEVELSKPRLFGLFKDELVEETLRADLQAMRRVYRERGWLDAVVELEDLEFSDDRSWVTVHVRVDEGPRYRVGSVDVETVERTADGDLVPAEPVLPEDELLALLELRRGSFYEQRVQQRDAAALTDRYGEEGYVYHPSLPELDRFEFLDARLVFEPDEPVVHVTYVVAQGRQQFVREIRIGGNTHTRDRVIRGRITVEPGEVANLREIERSRDRIRRLGFFSSDRPDVVHRDPYFVFRETDDPAWKDLEYVVEETNALSFQISGGVTSNSGLFGIVQLTKRNFDLFDPPSSLGSAVDEIADGRAFHGAGQTLRLLAAPGTETTTFEVRFSEPDVFRRHTDRIGLDLLARRRLRIFDSHDERRTEYGAGLRYQVGPDSDVSLGYTIGGVEVDDLDEGGEPTLGSPLPVPELLKAQEGTSDLGFLSLSYEFSDVDYPLSPQNGTSLEAALRLYDEALASDFEFGKLQVEWQHFGQFGPPSGDARPGYRFELDGGVAVPYGDDDDVPYTERFFLGGLRTLRGFDFRGVGPNEKGFPIGGETFLAGTIEYRHPLIETVQPGTFREVEIVRGGLFLDVGVLDPDPFALDLDEVRASVGFLLGLSVPLPITFSFGFPIREDDDDDTRTLGFDIGF